MDTSLNTLKSNAQTAVNDTASLQTSIPGMLGDLKKNLVSIYAKDNPVIQARDSALTNYLNIPSQTRVGQLPDNMPTVEGRALTLSPTQQDAIVSANTAAALVPLLGLNQQVMAGYGSIGDIVKGAADTYQSMVDAGKTRSNNALTLYEDAIKELAAKTSAANSGGLDLASILKLIEGGLGVNTPPKPPLSSFEDNSDGGITLPDPVTGMPTKLNLNVPPVSQNPGGSQPINLSNLSLNNIPLNLGTPSTGGLSIAGASQDPFKTLGLHLGGGY